ncbi:MAG: HIT family protein [Flavobacteriales bacterium]|nr:HIT family protein [Flavobacteriales bacterium]
MSTIFSKIVKREIPAYIVAEDDKHIAFLDAFPLVKGHTLVVPKKEYDYIFDIESKDYINLWKFAKNVERKMNISIECKRIAIVVIGLEVPHTHIHLIPINSVTDINFQKEKLKLTHDEFVKIASQIKSAI